ncbi:MAG TPA: hypothetical protein PK668_10845 [Myxococcota bacterium]|nr:hypothetical protein [Myxococcota bacterium]HRY93339.1 hypothetical protein [Myxococcota bacterium]HSA21054.1 hypothetical protein [Myxococcota bacterium]
MVETLVGTAVGTTEHDLAQLARIVSGLFAERGWVAPPEDPEAEGEHLRVRVQEHPGRGRWVFVERQPISQMPLVRELAARLGAAVLVHELVAREEVVRRADGELGFVCQARSLRVRPDGRLEPLAAKLEPDALRTAHGDLAQTASHLLRVLVGAAEDSSPAGQVLELFLPIGRRHDALTPRLADLAVQIALAGGYGLESLDGRRMLRLVLPDGARRLAVVTDQDLEILERVTGFGPPGAPPRPSAAAPRAPAAPKITSTPAAPAPTARTATRPAPKKPAPKRPAPKKPVPKRSTPKKPAPKRPAPKKPVPKKSSKKK